MRPMNGSCFAAVFLRPFQLATQNILQVYTEFGGTKLEYKRLRHCAAL